MGTKQHADHLRRYRLAEQKPLKFVASMFAQELILGRGLDALGNKRQTTRFSHADNRGCDGPIFLVGFQFLTMGPCGLSAQTLSGSILKFGSIRQPDDPHF